MPVVLVIEDDESYVLIRKICEATGFVVERATDAASAMVFAKRHHPEVIILAKQDLDGLVAIAELRGTVPDAVIGVICDSRDASVIDAGADVILLRPLDEQAFASALQAAAAKGPAHAGARRISLVVVEPDPHLAVVMNRWLASAYDITLVTTGWRAIEAIRRARPDAVLTELRLPDLDAPELHASIDRAAPGLADLTLFMTAGFVADRSQQFLARIPGQWIYKPFDLTSLRAALEQLLA